MRIVNKTVGVRDKAVFSSFNGGAYSDNPRAISERLHAVRPDLDLVWLFENPEDKRAVTPAYVRRVRFGSLRALAELATAKVWVDNTTKPAYVYKSKRQFYLQTWHGDRGFKTILLDSPNYLRGRRMVERACDLITTGSVHAEKVYRGGFGYQGSFLRAGTPRNDLLMRSEPARAAAIRLALHVPDGARVLLYAPTYRREAEHGAQTVALDATRTLDALSSATGQPWVCLLRAHTKVRSLEVFSGDPRVMDATSWEDMAELLLISDMLISDYSSSVGDFALTGRPIFLFQPDYKHFSDERTFYFNIDTSPFCIARNQSALEDLIKTVTPDSAAENDRSILKFFECYESGEATLRAADEILSFLSN